METHQTPPARARQHPLLIAAALAVILFCAVGTAAIMGWLPASSGSNRDRLSEADRATLAAGLQQPGQALQPAYAASGAAAPGAVPPDAVVTAPVQPLAQGYAPGAYPAAPAPAPAPSPAVVAQFAPGASAPIDPTSVAPKLARAEESGERWCGNCGNVESVRTITTRARGSGVGAAGGAILGGLLGNQVGGGHGRQLATVAGAVGGAVVGNQVEGNMNASTSYEIRVRLDDGTLRTFHQHSAPRWRNGDRVRVVKGSLRAA